jgi:hypothetical protein
VASGPHSCDQARSASAAADLPALATLGGRDLRDRLASRAFRLVLPLTAHASEFFSLTVPFLLKGNANDLQDLNVSIHSVSRILGLSATVTMLFQLLVAAACAYLLAVRIRLGGDDQASRLVACSALIVLAAFLCFSFSWNYYALYLFPALLGVALGRSAAPGCTLCLPLFLVGSPDVFLWRNAVWSDGGRTPVLGHLAGESVTAGYLILVGAYATALARPQSLQRVFQSVLSSPAAQG